MNAPSLSAICRGEVVHQRLSPVRHEFSYPMTFFALDLDELPKLHQNASFFRHNAPAPLSIRDRDYLHGLDQSIQQQIDALLPGRESGERLLTVTSPRYFSYAFNPVNFHLRMQGSSLTGAVAEVNNTFGDRHVYPLDHPEKTGPNTWQASCQKQFHVSPFNNMEGHYQFTFTVETDRLHLGVDLHRDGQCVMKTWISGHMRPLTNAYIRKYALFHPFDTAFNSMPRILWQAVLLRFRKRLSIHNRPSPDSPDTLIDRDKPSPAQHVI